MVTKRKIPFSAGNQTLSVQYIQLLYWLRYPSCDSSYSG
jgi:hypothetical protein